MPCPLPDMSAFSQKKYHVQRCLWHCARFLLPPRTQNGDKQRSCTKRFQPITIPSRAPCTRFCSFATKDTHPHVRANHTFCGYGKYKPVIPTHQADAVAPVNVKSILYLAGACGSRSSHKLKQADQTRLLTAKSQTRPTSEPQGR